MKILITGSGGYLGKNLREFLSNKYTIFTPSRKELNLLDEKAVEEYLKSRRVDVILHCAVSGGSRKEEQEEGALSNNLKIFFNIVRNEKHFKKMIHFGSGAEYDKRFPIIKVKEKEFDSRIPTDDYGFFKYICSKYIEKSDKIINLRVFGLFGKYEDYRVRFISNAICRNLCGFPITLKKDVYFDYVYIEDFVKIVDYFIKHKVKYNFYNIGTGKAINLLTIAEKINAISEKRSKIQVKEKGLQNEYSCSNTRLLKEMKKFTFIDIDTALQKLYEWYKVNRSFIDKNSL